jgi:hypothetical protein
MKASAEYFVIGFHHDFLGIADASQGGRSVTNDAELVVQELLHSRQLLPTQRLLYRDTMSRWDELVHDGRRVPGCRHIGGISSAMPSTVPVASLEGASHEYRSKDACRRPPHAPPHSLRSPGEGVAGLTGDGQERIHLHPVSRPMCEAAGAAPATSPQTRSGA